MNILQRHEDWVADRVGKITASRVKDISAKPRKGKALNATMTTLLTERLTGEIEDRRITHAASARRILATNNVAVGLHWPQLV